MTTSPDSQSTSPWLITLIVLTTLAAVAAGIYLSGTAGDLGTWIAESLFKAKARAEEKALEHVGEEKTRGFLKDQLKKNPVVSNDELNQVSSGLGDEAKAFSGKGGLGGMAEGIGKAFD